MPYVKLNDGNKIWYEEKGKGTPIIFIHGWLGSSWHFTNQINHFSKTHRVFTFDHKGHGKSDRPENAKYTIPEFAEELNQALTKIIGNQKFILAGHSMGGFISQIYATNPKLNKNLKALILMSTAPKFRNPALAEFTELIKKGELTILDPALVDTVLVPTCFNQKYIETHENIIKEFVAEILKNSEHVASKTAICIIEHYNAEDKLEKIDVPTLILAGDEDIFISPKEAELLHKKIKNSKLKIFSPNIGHMIQFEALNEYNKAVEEFLKKL